MMSFNIGPIAKTSSHLLSDLIEILVTLDYFKKGNASKNDIEDVLNHNPIDAEEITDELNNEEVEDGSTRQNRFETNIDDAWFMLNHRAKIYNNLYPFKISDEAIELKEDFASQHYIYILILFCSRLKSFKAKGIRQLWAKYFTQICKFVMSGIAPQNSIIRIFDANSDDRRLHYSTNLKTAIKMLAVEMSVLIQDQHLEMESTSGDMGIDIVAIYQFKDGVRTGNFVMFGQCGAQGENWPAKNFECHPDKFRAIFSTYSPIISIMFTPADYRTADGEWNKISNISGGTVIDRRRIINLLENSQSIKNLLKESLFPEFINEIKNIKNSL
ncbi:hypothetical protein [Acinetobacter sp. ANC 3813]|uniref:hypothetical protein n=1 Tax=Acinetobacter sp. ANC 3813 TaxID=1977873 RepID=UPI00148A577D|nr:hypothetical protein [Acinetobacter sp. ANC 3813]